MKRIGLLSIAFLASIGCHRTIHANSPIQKSTGMIQVDSSTPVNAPACILEKIATIRGQTVWNPPAEIHEYELEGKPVFVISADCCDRFTIAVDNTCSVICAPSGGFTGRGDGKCPDFFKKAKYLRLVWKDDREKAK